ncbi:oxysterol-binding protein-related protein 9-like [Sycon ciliatum]|uniref:oxysterol-binding protein-related protein 9-like n=1 Tax=Sycon ciliatum TaxID=27933 RepID=UPI0020AE199F|eukprot:scpid45138/ scgid8160/ Oxysterol-binding protein-related protein 9
MALINEGPLSKWTNVMKGWQYRWFVLDANQGLLSYYTSKSKMARGSRRGCMQLSNAIVGINDQDDSTFTLSTADNKTYHFEARDSDERDRWLQSLQAVINRPTSATGVASSVSVVSENSAAPWQEKLESEFCEAEGYHRLLDQQVVKLEMQVTGTNTATESAECKGVLDTSRALVDTIRQCLDMMQEVKTQLKSLEFGNGVNAANYPPVAPVVPGTEDANILVCRPATAVESSSTIVADVATIPTAGEEVPVAAAQAPDSPESGRAADSQEQTLDDDSESDSDDEFFDAEDMSDEEPESKPEAPAAAAEEQPLQGSFSSPDVYIAGGGIRLLPDVIRTEKDNLEAGMESNKSIITHLLSQVRIGMDLTKVVLPTFILEKRSMLEMYADFFAHADLFASIPDYEDAQKRFVETVRWYVSAFHAGRQSSLVKKPYNPILGETFQCMWDVSGRTEPCANDVPPSIVSTGPVPWATDNTVGFIAEQVSHHPPVAAFYAELASKKVSVTGHIWTKSKFLGLAVCAQMVGEAHLRLHRLDEEYIITFPSAYARSILTTPWMEMGGRCTIECPTTGYSAAIDFHCKPFYGGKRDRLTAELSHVSNKKPFMTLEGLWNATIDYKTPSGESGVFVDTKRMDIIKKLVRPLEDQDEFESRRLWDNVTQNLLTDNIEAATEFKAKLEERQRREAKERKEQGVEWVHKLFHSIGNGAYDYNTPVDQRLSENP